MLTYILVFILILLIGRLSSLNNTSKSKDYFQFFVLLLLVTLVSFRNLSVGADTVNYKNIFELITFDNLKSINIEIGFKVYTLLIKLVTNNYRIFFIITAFITFYGFLKFIKENSFIPWLSILVLIALFFLPSMNLMRQWLSMSIGINSFTLLRKKRYIFGIFVILIAASLHYMAISLLIIPILFLVKKNNFTLYFSLIAAIIIVLFSTRLLTFFVSIFPDHYQDYITNSFFQGTGDWGIKTLLYIFITLLMITLIKTKKTRIIKTGYYNEFYVLFIISIFTVIMTILGQSYYMIHRLGYYFSFFYVLSFVNIIPYFHKIKGIIKVLLILLIFTIFLYTIYTDNNGVVPYEIIREVSIYVKN